MKDDCHTIEGTFMGQIQVFNFVSRVIKKLKIFIDLLIFCSSQFEYLLLRISYPIARLLESICGWAGMQICDRIRIRSFDRKNSSQVYFLLFSFVFLLSLFCFLLFYYLFIQYLKNQILFCTSANIIWCIKGKRHSMPITSLDDPLARLGVAAMVDLPRAEELIGDWLLL